MSLGPTEGWFRIRPNEYRSSVWYELLMIGLAEGDVVLTFVQAILFGLYLASLAHCLRWQLVNDEGWRLRTKINWAMLIIAILLFLVLTIDLAIRLHLTIDAVQGDARYFKSPGFAVVSDSVN